MKPKRPNNYISPYTNLKAIRPKTNKHRNREDNFRFNNCDDIAIFEKYEKIVNEDYGSNYFNSKCTQ